ncbi:uncharacterized protein LOC124417365 isoform X1 [Gallus gallus]|uniref:uncharacterized protein LOC124417365 isoform X1 n=1 Tax=Gallus gallus TaxID=9031 RepID=UPI001F024533|nr:uncharacterized protein LOC124417365 isoform X1 [Gallus gallus]XP_046788066.1 uncharacterized protein LOC124417365 isoform X1 [Gallus gallus]
MRKPLDRSTHARAETAVRMRGLRDGSTHARFSRRYYACAGFETVVRMREVKDIILMRNVRDVNTHAQSWRWQYSCASRQTAVRMREHRDSSAHARAARLQYARASIETAVRMRTHLLMQHSGLEERNVSLSRRSKNGLSARTSGLRRNG